MSPTMLPVMSLPHPLVLLPTARVTLFVSKAVGESLQSVVETPDSQNIVVAVPTITLPTKTGDPLLSEHGVAARILQLRRSNSRNPAQAYQLTIAGLSRVKLRQPLQVKAKDLNSVIYCPVQYSPSEGLPSGATVAAFKVAALNLLDKLTKPGPRKEQWDRLSAVIEDISNEKAGTMADAMVSTVEGEFADKLGKLWISF